MFRALTGPTMVCLFVGSLPFVARAEVNVADPGTFVVDRAGIIDDRTERELESWLRELEQKTTAQIKVLTVPTLEGEDMFGFTQRHAERWKLGRKGKDNGALIAVALKDREFRIQTGYGLEPTLPDSWIGSLHRIVIVPNFRAGKYSEGLREAVIATANRVADASNVQLTGIPQFRHAPSRQVRVSPRGACGLGIVPFIIIILLLTRRRRRYRRWGGGLGEAIFWGSVLNNMGRGWGGGFGGGFKGFGGGGFGGSFGGGGRFGGGGGGGRW